MFFPLAEQTHLLQSQSETKECYKRSTKHDHHRSRLPPPPLAYPVAAGLAARHLGCELQLSLSFFLQSFIGNLISVVVRAVPLGQSDGQIILARLIPAMAALADEAATSPLDDIGGYAILADHASILHETLETRIYRT